MAKFLLISGAGEGLGLGLRLRFEGHDVATWIRDSKAKDRYNGLLRKLERWEQFLDKETTVVFDSRGGGKTADRLRSQGFRVVGGGTILDQLEGDPELSAGVLQQYAVQPNGIIETAFFDGTRFVGNESLWVVAKDRLMPGDLGPKVGTQGQLVWAAPQRELPKLADFFARHGYVGPIALSKDGFQPRWSAMPAALELYTTPVSEALTGGLPLLRSGFATSLSVATPSGTEGVLDGLTKEHRPHLYLQDVGLDKEGRVQLGRSGRALSVTGAGETPEEAFGEVYRLAEQVQLPDKMYRTDLAASLGKEREASFVTPMEVT